MNPSKATILIFRILGLDIAANKGQFKEIESLMELVFAKTTAQTQTKTPPKESPNDIKPEDNTINLQDMEHFELPKEFNLSMEGDEEHLQKIKIFPDGVSEEPAEPTPAPTPAVN